MSVILDALKKLDREKAFRKNTIGNIAVEILRPDLPRSGKRIGLYFAIIFLTAIATLAITYTVTERFGFWSRSSSPEAVNPSVSSPQAAPAPPESKLPTESSRAFVSPPAQSQEVVPAPILREPVRGVQKKENQVHPKIAAPTEIKAPLETKTPVETKTSVEIKAPAEPKPKIESKPLTETKPPVTSLDEKKTLIPEKVEPAPGSTRKAVETSPSASSATLPSLKLSAIVWYEEPSKRFAMINGNIAAEGSEVEGVKVVEINPTSVRFLHNGQYFEIPMSK